MRFFISILSLFIISCNGNSNYTSLSDEEVDIEFQLRSINPNDDEIEYWEVNYIMLFEPETIHFTGNEDLKSSLENKEFVNGFFQQCHPLHCTYNIVYYKNGEWNSISSEQDLKKFIGEIDNEFEAFLIARINEFYIDFSDSEGNGFYKSGENYFLKVMKYESCPVSKESFLLEITEDGEIKSQKSLGYYYKSKDCIIS